MARRKLKQQRGSTGRPKAEVVKDRFVSFRVTEEELFKLMDKAERSGVSHVEFARSRALRGIARGKKKDSRGEVFGEFDRALFHEARKQGVNLNQIAHHCNAFRVPPPREFVVLLKKLNALWDKLLAQS
jgi:hypothetical protein